MAGTRVCGVAAVYAAKAAGRGRAPCQARNAGGVLDERSSSLLTSERGVVRNATGPFERSDPLAIDSRSRRQNGFTVDRVSDTRRPG